MRRSSSDSRKHIHVVWDEKNLEENEKIQAQFAGINIPEPKTPYHGPLGEQDSEDGMQPLQLDGVLSAFEQHIANGEHSGWTTSNSNSEAGTSRPTSSGSEGEGGGERKRRFAQMRRQHYDMRSALTRGRVLAGSEDGEDGPEAATSMDRDGTESEPEPEGRQGVGASSSSRAGRNRGSSTSSRAPAGAGGSGRGSNSNANQRGDRSEMLEGGSCRSAEGRDEGVAKFSRRGAMRSAHGPPAACLSGGGADPSVLPTHQQQPQQVPTGSSCGRTSSADMAEADEEGISQPRSSTRVSFESDSAAAAAAAGEAGGRGHRVSWVDENLGGNVDDGGQGGPRRLHQYAPNHQQS